MLAALLFKCRLRNGSKKLADYIVVLMYKENLTKKVIELSANSKADAEFAIKARYPSWEILSIKEIIDPED
jgi:hypothetical protein